MLSYELWLNGFSFEQNTLDEFASPFSLTGLNYPFLDLKNIKLPEKEGTRDFIFLIECCEVQPEVVHISFWKYRCVSV